ncbi:MULTISPECIES: MOSC domain-containing protein [unclassified Arthrobacter]|uniref:MOSC domain-containing protein n=1 Tax=unclassified Arthrobacter TaxID=235627 RepID=UPI00159E3B77|nr:MULTISPECIES: MOSC domain-containing protein [unclassified Arthrobacter]MCQ9164988.1 MOSC domain-containing protein [Arthrobacter sp. STN4]NVM97110.1 MOSC domain-containing protein [Arthrobacter sp. SDTb3-6]
MTDSPDGTVLALCRVHETARTMTGFGITGIDKRPVAGAVSVRTFGVFGDVQGDREHHGGPDQAVYAYSQEDADYWGRELGRDIPPGLFGENLRTQGVETTGAVIGQRWRVGRHLLLEVTNPRVPCATFAERMGERQWVRRFTEAGRVGVYFRVLRKGKVQAGDTITVEPAPAHGITVGRFFSHPTVADVHTLQALHDAGELTLSAHYGKYFRRILDNA